MKAIEIHNASGAVVATVGINEGARAVYTLGSEDYVVLPFTLQEPVGIDAGCWVDLSEVLGPEMGGKAAKRYEVTEPVSARYDESTGGYSYELKLHAYYMAWGKKLFKYMPGTGGAEVAWNLTADLGTHMQVFLRNLSAYGFTYNGESYVVAVDSTVDASAAHLLQYSTTYLIDALNMIAQSWQCEWWVTDKTIHFGRLEHSDAMPLHIGVEAERMERTDSKGKYATRLYVYGASHNLPPTYPDDSRKVTADVTKNGVVQRRLMLPEGVPYLDAYRYKSDGTRVYIGAKGYNDGTTRPMPTAEAMEGVLVKDDIYPRTESAISAVGSYEKTATADDGSGDTVTQRFYYVSTDGIGFDETYMLEASTLQIRLTSGKMNGMLFDCIFRKAGTEVGGVTLEADVFELVASDESTYGRVLPDALLHPETGDKMVLLGWDSSKMEDMGLVGVAEDALLEAGKAYIQRTMKQDGTVSVTLMSHWAAEDATARTFTPGQRVELYNDALWADGKRGSRVIGYDIKLDLPYDHPRYTIGESVEYSRITAIEDKVQEIVVNGASFIGGGTGGGTSVYLIKTNDGTAPSDYNAYSAARSDRNYLSKTHDDATPHSLAIGGTVKAGTAEAGVIKTTGAKKGGMDGTGVIADGGALEVDTLTVRRKAVFNELEIKRTSYAGGDTIYSFAGNKIVEVSNQRADDHGYYYRRCYYLAKDGENTITDDWRVGDQAMCKTANLDGGQRYYWRLVVAHGTTEDGSMHWVDLSDESGSYINTVPVTDEDGRYYTALKSYDTSVANDTPMAGDVIVQLGNQLVPSARGFAYAVYVSEGRRVDYVGIGSSDDPFNLDKRISADLRPTGWSVNNSYFHWQYKDNLGEIKDAELTIFMGDWRADVVYQRNMVVLYNGAQYLCIKDISTVTSTQGGALPTNTTYWKAIGGKGEPGASVESFVTYFGRFNQATGVTISNWGSLKDPAAGTNLNFIEPTEEWPYVWCYDFIRYTDGSDTSTTPRVVSTYVRDGQDGQDGAPGNDGKDGEDGKPGAPGKDAYSLVVTPAMLSFEMDENGKVLIDSTHNVGSVCTFKVMKGDRQVYHYIKTTPITYHCDAVINDEDFYITKVHTQTIDGVVMPYGDGYVDFFIEADGIEFEVMVPFTVSGAKLSSKFYHDNKEFVSRFASWQLDGGQYVQMSESYIEQKAEQVALGVTEKMSYTGANLLPSSDFKQYDTRQEIVCVTSDDINQSDSPQYVKVYPVLGSTYNGQQVWRIYCKGVSENTFGCLRFILSNTVVGRKYKARTYVRRIGYIGDGGTKDYIQLVDITSNDRKGYNNWGNSDGCYERDLSSSWRMFEVYSRDAYSSAYTYNEFAIILNRRGYIEFTTPIVDGYAGNIEVYPVEISSTDARVTKTLIAHAPDESHNGQNYLRMYAKNNTSDIFAMMKYDVSGLMKKSNNAEYNVGGGVKNYGDTTYVFSVWVKRGHSKYDGSHTIYIDAVDESADKWIAGYEKNCNEIEDGAWHRISIKLPGFSGSGRVTMCVKNNGDMLFSEPQLEEGVVPTPWMPRVAVADELRRTGIDITSGRIDMQADHFTLRNAAGEQTMGVDEDGNAEFTGKLNASGFVVRNTANGLPGMRMDFDDQGRPHLIFYDENGLEAYDLGYAGGLSKIIDMVSKGSFSEKSPYYYVSDVNSLGGNLFNTVVNATGKYYQYAAPRINLQNGTGQIKDGYEIYDNKCYKTATYLVEDTGFLGSTANYAASGFYVQGAMWMESTMYGGYAPKPVIQIKGGKIVGVVGYLYADRNKITSYRSASSLAAMQALSADEPSMLSLGDEDYADDGANADNGASTINYHEANVANVANGDVTGDAEAGDGVTDASDSVVDAGDGVTDDVSTPTEPQEPSAE